jgi:hypothetical protein
MVGRREDPRTDLVVYCCMVDTFSYVPLRSVPAVFEILGGLRIMPLNSHLSSLLTRERKETKGSEKVQQCYHHRVVLKSILYII